MRRNELWKSEQNMTLFPGTMAVAVALRAVTEEAVFPSRACKDAGASRPVRRLGPTTRGRVLCALAALICLTLALPAPGAGAEEDVASAGISAADLEAQADALMAAGRFADAAALLRPAVEQEGASLTLVFLYGLASVEASQQLGVSGEEHASLLKEAVAAFHSMLVQHPELVRVRLELARAFFLQGEDSLARRHFEQVLAGEPPEAVVANVQAFLGQIRARRRWDAYFGFAAAPDSNLNATSAERTILLDTPFGRLPFTLDRPVARESGIGFSVWGGGEYQYPLAERRRLRAGGGASVREYTGSYFDEHFAYGHVGPRWLIGRGTDVSLLAVVQRHWSAGIPDTDEYGLRLEGDHWFGRRLAIDGQIGLRRRSVRNRDWLDGPTADVRAGFVWAALPVLRVDARAGYNWSRAHSEDWRTRGPNVSLGASLALPAGFTLGAQAYMRWTNYQDQGSGAPHHTIDRKPRKDKTRIVSLSVHNRAITLLGFSPRVSVTNERRDTNAQTLDYDRNRAELSFVRQF